MIEMVEMVAMIIVEKEIVQVDIIHWIVIVSDQDTACVITSELYFVRIDLVNGSHNACAIALNEDFVVRNSSSCKLFLDSRVDFDMTSRCFQCKAMGAEHPRLALMLFLERLTRTLRSLEAFILDRTFQMSTKCVLEGKHIFVAVAREKPGAWNIHLRRKSILLAIKNKKISVVVDLMLREGTFIIEISAPFHKVRKVLLIGRELRLCPCQGFD